MSELQERLNALSGRGTPRGVDAVFGEATRIAATTEDADVEAHHDELDSIPFVTAEPARRRRRPLSSLIAATGVTTLLLVSMLAVTAFIGSGGANSPEAAVRKLADAISHEDPLAAADVLAPSEVQSLHGTLDAASKRAAELTLVEQAGAPLSGLDFSVDDLTMTTESYGADYAKVVLQGGTLRGRSEHGKFSPLVQRSLGEPSNGEASTDLAEGWDNGNELFVVAVREDGDWYISAAYTTLEYIRVAGGAPPAEFGSGVNNIATLGADSPQAAVENGMRALQASDWATLISLADPKELPLYDYRAALIDLATRDEMRTDFTIANMSTKATVSGDTAKVRLTADGKTSSGDSWAVDGGCFTPPESSYYGVDGEPVAAGDVPAMCVGSRFGLGWGLFFGFGAPDDTSGPSEITVVQRNGRWFVSPVGTALDVLNTWVANMDQRALLLLMQQPEQLPPDGTLTLNQPVQLPAASGFLSAAMYEFDGKAGQEVLAEVTPNRTDYCCYFNVVILNPDGSYVSDGTMPTAGNPVRLPSDARYRVLVTTYTQDAETLTLWEAAKAPADLRKKTSETCRWEGNNLTTCGSNGTGELDSESETKGSLGIGESCIEEEGFSACSSEVTEAESAPVPASTAPTTVP